MLPARVFDEVPAARPARRPQAAGPRLTLDTLNTGDPDCRLSSTGRAACSAADIPILIQGESGAGKEMLAKAFHNSGPRRDAPFVALNCASIPET